jgi:hypothetical protein
MIRMAAAAAITLVPLSAVDVRSVGDEVEFYESVRAASGRMTDSAGSCVCPGLSVAVFLRIVVVKLIVVGFVQHSPASWSNTRFSPDVSDAVCP